MPNQQTPIKQTQNYKSYIATLTQSGTNPPVATVLVNELNGLPVWSRGGAGSYLATLTGEFINNKTTITTNTPGASGFVVIQSYFEDINTVYIDTFENDQVAPGYKDDLIYNFLNVEIRVYN